MTALAIDIETVPTKAALQLAYPVDERQPPANYKSADAIANWRTNDEAAWLESRIKDYSLDARYGRVVAIGIATESAGDSVFAASLVAPTEADEADVLRTLWQRVSHDAEPVVTWNGAGFDVPFLLVRSALLGVSTPTAMPLTKRYSSQFHFDVKAVLYGWDSSRMNKRGNGLGEWAQAFGLPTKVAHGSDVYEMYRNKDFDAISAYAADDAKLTLQLYHRIATVFA